MIWDLVFSYQLTYLGGTEMAKKKQSGSRGNGQKVDYGVDFANVRLSDDEKRMLFEETPSDGDLMSEIIRNAESGFKFTLSWNERNGSYIATFTSEKNPETGRKTGISGFGPDVSLAVSAAIYKLAKVTDGGNWQLDDITEEWSTIG
jgi:hypothetical protein